MFDAMQFLVFSFFYLSGVTSGKPQITLFSDTHCKFSTECVKLHCSSRHASTLKLGNLCAINLKKKPCYHEETALCVVTAV